MAADRITMTRYVALGDSTSEGLEDPYPGGGYRGWTDRLAQRIAREHPGLLYANLAVRGKLAGQVRAEQLDAALALEPDVATVVAGLNDALRPSCSVAAVAADLSAMFSALRTAGAVVATLTYPDPASVNPLARAARGRLEALNAAIRESAEHHGVAVADLARHRDAGDPRLWHPDRLHANPEGHARVAGAMAAALGLPDGGARWDEPLPPAPPQPLRARVAGHAVWAGRYLAPWVARRLRGRSSGDGMVAKRPALLPVDEPA